jgi:hypothetical protein
MKKEQVKETKHKKRQFPPGIGGMIVNIFEAPKATNRRSIFDLLLGTIFKVFQAVLSHCFWTVNLLSKTVNSRLFHMLLQDYFRTVTQSDNSPLEKLLLVM